MLHGPILTGVLINVLSFQVLTRIVNMIQQIKSISHKIMCIVQQMPNSHFQFTGMLMLLRAEALNKMERKEEAIDIVLAVRKRVGYNGGIPFTTTKEDLENEILLERQLEFFAEGKRWFDLMRTDKLKEVMEPVYQERQAMMGETPTAFDMNRAYGPIYYKEFEANAALRGHQNPPYSE